MAQDHPAHQRGLVLFEQGRYADAADRFREALTVDPNDPRAHAMLSLCLTRLDQLEPATTEARLAIRDDPAMPLGFYALAAVMYERNRDEEAFDAIEQAITLDQYNPSYFGLKAALHLRQKSWTGAVNAADAGLAIDPQDSLCLNVRAQALVKLGLRDQAASTMQDALANDPENSLMHANQGWALLHAGRHKEAMGHFRESLRIDPTNDWAKVGVVESLKASFFLYRWLLMYFLWMSRLSSGAQNGIIFGGFIGYQLLKGLAQSQPAIAPFVWPILIAYMAFALMTWLGGSLLNLMLRLHPVGRYALTSDQKRTSEIVGALLLLTLVFAVLAVINKGADPFVTLAITCFVVSLPASHILDCAKGWPRSLMLAITLSVAGIGVLAAFAQREGLFGILLIAAIASQFAAISLGRVRPKR